MQVLGKNLKQDDDVDSQYLVGHTPDLVGDDLMTLTRKTPMSNVNMVFTKREFCDVGCECVT